MRVIIDNDTGEHDHAPADAPIDLEGLNERQKWVLDLIRNEQILRRWELEQKFGVSSKTAKRDLKVLVKADRIEFIRKPHPGFYRGKKV